MWVARRPLAHLPHIDAPMRLSSSYGASISNAAGAGFSDNGGAGPSTGSDSGIDTPVVPHDSALRAHTGGLVGAFIGNSASKHEVVVPELPTKSSNVSFPEVAARVVQLERRGKGRKLIAMSLYGNDTRYTFGALENALLVKRDWKGWVLRIYVGEGVPSDILAALAALGVELVRVESIQRGIAGMFWRFFAVEDRTATRILIRDCDSRLNSRDRTAVDEWVKSGRFFHTMRDHSHHKTPILGGMWGTVGGFINPGVLQAWRNEDRNASHDYLKKDDQFWLAREIWPHVRKYNLMHASWHCKNYKSEWRSFPTQREGDRDFVGNAFHPGNHFLGRPYTEECPLECRRNATWTLC